MWNIWKTLKVRSSYCSSSGYRECIRRITELARSTDQENERLVQLFAPRTRQEKRRYLFEIVAVRLSFILRGLQPRLGPSPAWDSIVRHAIDIAATEFVCDGTFPFGRNGVPQCLDGYALALSQPDERERAASIGGRLARNLGLETTPSGLEEASRVLYSSALAAMHDAANVEWERLLGLHRSAGPWLKRHPDVSLTSAAEAR